MAAANNLIPYKLPTQNFVANANVVVTLKDLPKRLLGRLAHVQKIIADVVLTPTFTTAPTTQGHNAAVKQFDFWDGSFLRFQGGFNALRARERMHFGKVRTADADTNGSTGTARYFRRVFHTGPAQMLGAPSDFLIPTGMLSDGEIRITFGALTDISADTTACSGTVRITAWLALLDEIRIPPAVEMVAISMTGKDATLSGRALYENISIINSAAYDNFSAGGLGNITVDFGFGQIVPAVASVALAAGFNDDFESGQYDAVQGSLDGATDTAVKTANRATPTALTSVNNDLQPVVWTPRSSRISKMFLAESAVRLTWDGSQTSAVALVSRIRAQPQTVVSAAIQKALAPLTGLSAQKFAIATLSKVPYNGPYGEFMPWKVKVG